MVQFLNCPCIYALGNNLDTNIHIKILCGVNKTEYDFYYYLILYFEIGLLESKVYI